MATNSPSPQVHQIIELCTSKYRLSRDISVFRLPGENPTYQITTADQHQFVLKLAGNEFSSDLSELEYFAVEHLRARGITIDLPHILPTKEGMLEAVYTTKDGLRLRGRMFDYISGTPWCESGRPTAKRLSELGHLIGSVDFALSEIAHPTAHRTHQWDLCKLAQHRHKVSLEADPQRRKILDWFFHCFEAYAAPYLANLPHSLIHADINDENLLLKDDKISGLLDFSDCLYNPTICELAIALAYAMLSQPDPIEVGAIIVKGYQTIYPLSEEELAVLYPLICGRLCTTLAISAERRLIAPDHPNWFVTEERAWALIEQLYLLDYDDACSRLAMGITENIDGHHGTSLETITQNRERYIGPSLSIAYHKPIKMVRGKGQFLFDHRGRPFLDLVNNVCHVGHCHAYVVEAGQKQMARLNTNTRYLYDSLIEYAQRLSDTLPEPLDTCFFVNSGSEANELALRLAMAHTNRKDFAVLDGAYHGNTSKLIDISPYKFMGQGGRGKPEPWVHIVPMPDGYRGLYKGDSPATGKAYGDEVGRVISKAGTMLAGFITESLMGCGGQIIPPVGYLETAFQHVRNAGGLCIIDEVQVGFGRVGSHFWAFEQQGVIPDIVVMGKPIGNGHPMAAVVTTYKIASSFANGMEFFSTFGGNPVSCAIGLAVLDVIRDEGLQQHALELGNYFQDGLRELTNKHAIIGDVRGAGLFIGVELVRDRDSLLPAAEEASEFIQRMKERGILLSTDGPLHNVIKIKPPMVLNKGDVGMVLRAFDDVLTKL